ncbi:MAG: BolA family transcriptional regulator [Gammaproteobacteria bacterium]|nr:BolA family transcriptional regulator [Gammaproteobacteria bacterium]
MSASRIEQIRSRIETAFAPISLEIIDESHKHAGHASAKGGGHFIVQIVSDAFADKSTIQRHRMVYEAMGELMQHEVHALSIQAKTPQES